MAEQTGGAALAGALGWVAAGTMVANAFAYLIHLAASRWWSSTAEYGELAVGLSAILVLGVAALALQAVVARAVVHRADPARIRRVTVQTVVIVGGLVVVAAPMLAAVASLGVTTALASLASAPMLTLIYAGLGVLQGRGAFRLLAWMLAAVGVLRNVPMLIAIAAGASPAGVLAAGAAGGVVAAVLVTWVVRSSSASSSVAASAVAASDAADDAGLTLLDVARASGVQLVLVVATSIDLLLARSVLTPDDAGIYALGAIATKVAFWLPQAVGVVFYPRLADPATSRRSLVHAIAVVSAIGVVLTVGAGVAGPLVPIMVRADYAPLVPILWVFAYTGSMLAVLQVALLSAIARRATAVSWVTWVVVAVESAVILTVVDTILALAVTAAVAATLAAVTTTLVGLRRRETSPAGADATRD
ncbi:hypothetical protein [Gordonia rhizosphera]|uniref:Polysaccharide biosynthesis protein n=1 Tax=Gordonia rhizosphera NBRC 16068 TaxID=1108045 RepID=K6VWW1_9ACTN|nr:hypothetical protein [Gordonia rhizosphera]GAB91385.1 hypothetical protein GORHZ_130_00080 [Gordonia rhizosphera NBRC 16068]